MLWVRVLTPDYYLLAAWSWTSDLICYWLNFLFCKMGMFIEPTSWGSYGVWVIYYIQNIQRNAWHIINIQKLFVVFTAQRHFQRCKSKSNLKSKKQLPFCCCQHYMLIRFKKILFSYKLLILRFTELDLRNLKYSQHQIFVFAFLTGKLKHWQVPFNLIFNSYPFGDYT